MHIWVASWQNDWMPSEDRPASGHLPSLIRVLVMRCGKLRTQALFMWTANTLIRLGRCSGWFESSQGAHPFCWFCQEVAHLNIIMQTCRPILKPRSCLSINSTLKVLSKTVADDILQFCFYYFPEKRRLCISSESSVLFFFSENNLRSLFCLKN